MWWLTHQSYPASVSSTERLPRRVGTADALRLSAAWDISAANTANILRRSAVAAHRQTDRRGDRPTDRRPDKPTDGRPDKRRTRQQR